MSREKSRGEISMGTILEVVLGALYLLTLASVLAAPNNIVTMIIFIAFAVVLLVFAILLAIAGMRLESRHG